MNTLGTTLACDNGNDNDNYNDNDNNDTVGCRF